MRANVSFGRRRGGEKLAQIARDEEIQGNSPKMWGVVCVLQS